MYEFPKRIIQHKNETKALAIFLYHLRDFGIVRDVRENDYGIDLEYEFVAGENVIGRVIKIQLKSIKLAKNEGNREAAAILIHHMALVPTINEILLTHKNILGRIDEIMEFCSSAIYRDQF